MSKLFVITYKRPALSIEKITMDIDNAYDCESAHTEELAQIKLKDAQNKYDEVEMFECEDYEYVEFMKNDEAVAHFTKTGEHFMKPIEGMDEDVDVGVESKTITIECQVRLQRETNDATFDYNVDIDDVGQVVFTPYDTGTRFCHEGEVFEEDENIKLDTVKLTAQMLSESDNYEYFTGTDDIGQFVITPDAEDTSFISVSVDNSLNLVTESANKLVMEDAEPGSEEFNSRLQECAERVTTLKELFESAISIAEDIENDFRALGCHSADIDGYMIRYLEKFIEDREGEVSCAEFVRRIEEASALAETEDTVEESVKPVNENDVVMEGNDIVMEKVDELDRHNIIDRFMKGDIGIFSDDGEPADSYIHLDELDTVNGKTSYKYYYDEESDAVVCYSSRAPR